jgi:hypothetical protein
MWGWIPGGGTIGTSRWAYGKAKGRPRPRTSGSFFDDLAVFAREVEREAAIRKAEKKSKEKK